MDLIITILPVVTKDLPISPRFTPYNFYSDASSALLQLVNQWLNLFAHVFRMTYFCPSWKRPSPCFQYVPTTVVVLIRQPSQNKHTFCQRFRSPYVFWSSSSLLVDETAEVVLPSATSTEFDSNWVYSSLYLLSTVLLYTTYQVLCLKKNAVVQ